MNETLSAAVATRDPIVILLVGLFFLLALLIAFMFSYFRSVNKQLISTISKDNERLIDLKRELWDSSCNVTLRDRRVQNLPIENDLRNRSL